MKIRDASPKVGPEFGLDGPPGFGGDLWLQASRLWKISRVFLRVTVRLAGVAVREPKRFKLRYPPIIREALEELGMTFVKLGQFIALRFDILSQEMCDELRKLFDNVGSFPAEQAVRVIESEFKLPLAEVFPEFNPIPIASASVAQVHEAWTSEGVRVAVKLQRPGVRRIFEADLRNLHRFAVIMDIIDPNGHASARDLVAEFRSWTSRELTFRFEGRMAERVRENALSFEIVPKVFWDLTTDRVLTLEFIEGVNLTRLNEWKTEGGLERIHEFLPHLDLDLAMHRLSVASLRQLFVTGVFHADLHPGNLMVRDDNTIAFLDFGLSGEVTPQQRSILRTHYQAFAVGDFDLSAEAYAKLWTPTDNTDLIAFTRDTKAELRRWYLASTAPDASPEDQHWGEFAENLTAFVRRNNMRMGMDMALFMRALGILHATLVLFSVNFVGEVNNFFRKESEKNRHSMLTDGIDLRPVNALIDLTTDGPTQMASVLKRFIHQRYEWDTEIEESDDNRAALHRLAKAVTATALAVSCFLLSLSPHVTSAFQAIAGVSGCVLFLVAGRMLALRRSMSTFPESNAP